MNEIDALKEKSDLLRREVFQMIVDAGGGHITPSFSIVEILSVLYFKILKIDGKNLWEENRDRFILSKGHGGATLFAALVLSGLADRSVLKNYCRPDGILGGHPDIQAIPGVEATTGSLGHGFAFGVGIALAGQMDRKDYRTFVLLGDGECQEGTIWEAAQFAAHHKLDNLIAVIDYNKLQAMGVIREILDLEPFADKWRSFNWSVREVDGHDVAELAQIFSEIPFQKGKPSLIIAHTVKGKGISFMENVPIWHYRLPNEEEMKICRKELEI